MKTIVTVLAEQHAELSGLLSGLTEADWQRPTPCEGWTVADVVLHLAQTDELAIGSARGRLDEAADALVGDAGPAISVDDAAARMVTRQRGQPGAAVRDRWQASADELRRVLGECDPRTRVVWVAGELSARTLATTRVAETWIHTNDVADALGLTLAPTDRLWHVSRLAWRTLPYAFERSGRELGGPVAFKLRGPSGDAWDFRPETTALTTIRGEAVDLCNVAARRVDPEDTSLRGSGPDVRSVLELVRTYAQ